MSAEFGQPFPAPHTPPLPPKDRSTDHLVAWLVFGVHTIIALSLWGFSAFTIFLTDSCGTSTTDEPAICESGYLSTLLVAYWSVLGLGLVVSLVALIVATVRKSRAWPWAVGSVAVMVVASVVFFVLVTR